jgi:hypothetical protein
MAERVWCEIRRDAEIQTPRLCVRCTSLTHDTVEVGIRSYTWTTAFGFYGKGNTRKFPACPACASAMRTRLRVGIVVNALAMLLPVAAAIAFVPAGSPKWHGLAVICAGFIAVHIIAAIALLPFPVAVKLESTLKGLRVDFWNPKFGNIFRILNEAITIDDQPKRGHQTAPSTGNPAQNVETKPPQPRPVPIRELVPDAAARDRVLYDFTHRFLPAYAAERRPSFEPVLTGEIKPLDFIISRWVMMEQKRARAAGTAAPSGWPAELAATKVRIGGKPALLVKMPPPEQPTHAYLVAIVLEDPGSAEPPMPMTFTLEHTSADPSGATGVVCMWRDSQHLNSGGRVKVSTDAFVRACESWMTKQPA